MTGKYYRRASAAPAPPALRFELGDGRVYVYLGRDAVAPIQAVPFDSDALTGVNRPYFLSTPDINFDGYPDLLLIHSQGLQNTYYDGWIWSPVARRFFYDRAIRALPNPTFDGRDRRIYTFEHGSATDSDEAVYAYQGGALVQIERREQRYDQATGELVVRTYAPGPDGRMRLISEERMPIEPDA
ncbi:MAG: hypothetical protein GX558_02030 [Clostridiales bacterium]|nr:hypothetical protein [Clostridiales bacterium]